MRLGCPPGLRFLFDEIESLGGHNQYCKQHTNLTCYYFENGKKNHVIIYISFDGINLAWHV